MVLKNIDYHICDTCVLNCVSCNHFSPLADKPNMKTEDDARRDFWVLSKFRDRFDCLTILGGEALLNNDLGKILDAANGFFPNRIKLITNGVMVDRLMDLRTIIIDNGIHLVVTEYPFKDGYAEHYDRIRKKFPNAVFYKYRVEHGFLKHHLSYAETGVSDSVVYGCDKRDKCCNYVDGKLYICHYAAFLPFLNGITDTGIDNSDSFIDLKTCTESEFDSFFENAIPNICRHCLYVTKSYEEHEKQKWTRTAYNPNEWIV